MSTSGVADSPFVKFEGGDVLGNDVAYYPDLKNNVKKLKDIILNKPGSLYYAFKTLGKFGKGLMVFGAVASVYSVTVADDWKYELGKQVAYWFGAIAGGYLGGRAG
jgi:hypothetical protein